MLQKIIKLYYSILIPMTPSNSWKKLWREHRRTFATDTDNLALNRKRFRKRYKEEGYDWSKYKRYRRDYLLCYLFFCLTADEYFQYGFMHKGWLWRNHHVTIERRKFIDSIINNENASETLANKALFNNYYEEYIYRKWCDLRTVTLDEFINIFETCERVVVKPRGRFGGVGVEVYDTDKESLTTLYNKKIKTNPNFNYIVEEYLEQKGVLHDINPDSLNSIRITSIRTNSNVEIIDGFFRCGCGKVIVDNFSSGGFIFPYDVNTGILFCGHNQSAQEVSVHPISNIKIEGMRIPDYDLIVETVKKVHLMAPEDINLVGWDVCVIDGKVILIEGNSKPGYTSLYDPGNNLWGKFKVHLNSKES